MSMSANSSITNQDYNGFLDMTMPCKSIKSESSFNSLERRRHSVDSPNERLKCIQETQVDEDTAFNVAETVPEEKKMELPQVDVNLVNALRADIRMLEDMNVALEKKLEDSEYNCQRLKDDLQRSENLRTEEIRSNITLRMEKQELNRENSILQTRIAALKKTAFQEEMDARQVAELNGEMENMKKYRKMRTNDTDFSTTAPSLISKSDEQSLLEMKIREESLKEQLETFKNENEILKKKSQEQQDHLQQIEKKNSKLETFKNENEILKKKSQEQQDHLQQIEKINSKLDLDLNIERGKINQFMEWSIKSPFLQEQTPRPQSSESEAS